MPVPQPDPTTEAELLALLSPAVTDLCRKHGLSLAGPKADKVARLQSLLFPVGGGGGGGDGGGGGGLGHLIGGIYDSRPPYAQMMSATGNNTALVGEIATVFSRSYSRRVFGRCRVAILGDKGRHGHRGGYVHTNNIESGVHHARWVAEVELRR